jgi:hypothetical protein
MVLTGAPMLFEFITSSLETKNAVFAPARIASKTGEAARSSSSKREILNTTFVHFYGLRESGKVGRQKTNIYLFKNIQFTLTKAQ